MGKFLCVMAGMGATVLLITHVLNAFAHHAAQSWDQENLKRNDHGCPTAIYVAPGGNLEQCR